jgi:hypothetical protein
MEDASKVFGRGGGATQSAADGARSFYAATQIVGGTGRLLNRKEFDMIGVFVTISLRTQFRRASPAKDR